MDDLKSDISAVPLFRETQSFGWWVPLLLASVAGLMWSIAATLPKPANILFLFIATAVTLFAIVLTLGLLRMTTVVTSDNVHIWFGWGATYRKIVPVGQVREIEVVSYSPIADCGGWGIRFGRGGESVLNARGDRGVRLQLADGARLLIGSQRPEELAEALRSRIHREQTEASGGA